MVDLNHAPDTLDPSYLLAYFMAEQQPGDEFTNWPLHITIIPWFRVNNIEQVDTGLQTVAERTGPFRPFRVCGQGQAQFGDYQVRLIEPVSLMKAIHQQIYQLLQNKQARFISTRFFGDNYVPHISHQSGSSFGHGQVALISGFYLLKRYRQSQSDKYIKIVAKGYKFYE